MSEQLSYNLPTQTHVASRRMTFPTIITGILSIVWLVFAFYPVFYVLFTSFHSKSGFLLGNVWLPPTHPTLANYAQVLDSGFARYLFNSAFVSVISVVCIVLFSLTASYVLVKVTNNFSRTIFNIILIALAIPLQALIIPIYSMIYHAGLYDTFLGLILPSIAFGLPLSILILVNFLRDIPNELYEAMQLDGVGEYGMLWYLIVPLSIPALIAVAIYQFIQVWNNFLFPLILTQSTNMKLLPLAIVSFEGQYTIDVPAVMAAVVLSALPLIIGYILSRKYLLRAMAGAFSMSR
jgi:raffinose/stachyose/melibiose transport system permease protein